MVPTKPSPWAERRPSKQTISEENFRPLFVNQIQDLAKIANGLLESNTEQWSQRQLVHLFRGATEVESFLDDHGARRNRAYFRIREILALNRWLAYGLSSLVHLHSRLPSYQVVDRKWVDEVLGERVRSGALRLGEMLNASLQGLRDECSLAGATWPEETLRVASLSVDSAVTHLPVDRVERSSEPLESDQVASARFVNQFINLFEAWSPEARVWKSSAEDLPAFMASYCSEEIARRIEARVHNLQSSYDTLVAGSAEEERLPELAALRGTASQVLHLLEMVTALTHLYERHDIYERQGESRALFERYVSESELLEVVINKGVVTAYECLMQARPAAEALLQELRVADELELTLPEGVVMHARPLSLVVTIVQKHGTPVELTVAGESCTAASMMQLLILAGSHPQERTYKFSGDPAVLNDLRLLFEHRLGEDGFESFPRELGYLRR